MVRRAKFVCRARHVVPLRHQCAASQESTIAPHLCAGTGLRPAGRLKPTLLNRFFGGSPLLQQRELDFSPAKRHRERIVALATEILRPGAKARDKVAAEVPERSSAPPPHECGGSHLCPCCIRELREVSLSCYTTALATCGTGVIFTSACQRGLCYKNPYLQPMRAPARQMN